MPLERAWAQVFREGGARVVENQLFREVGLPNVLPSDQRRLEVVAYGLPLHGGLPLCVDATLVSALTGDGHPHHAEAGRAFLEAEKTKARTYPELAEGTHAKLLVVGHEVGGRWSEQAAQTLRKLAAHKVQEAPLMLRGSLEPALIARWSSLVSVAAQSAYAASLSAVGVRGGASAAGSLVSWGEL